MQKVWNDKAWSDYLYWQKKDKNILRKINSLLKEIERNPNRPPGKSEKLKGQLSGCNSSRITQEHRLVWYYESRKIYVLACRGHYRD